MDTDWDVHDEREELKKCREDLHAALSSLQSIVDITEEERPPAPDCYIREVAIQAIARHALTGAA